MLLEEKLELLRLIIKIAGKLIISVSFHFAPDSFEYFRMRLVLFCWREAIDTKMNPWFTRTKVFNRNSNLELNL